MPLRLQDPENSSSPYLLESVLEACENATSGGGLFAWASGTGLRLLLRDKTFTHFVKHHDFELLVGLDLVTDARALREMQLLAEDYPKITARVFLHRRASTIFHPKTCWFRRVGHGGTLVVGSGNLTVGGLRANWEAYTVTSLSEKEAQAVERDWRDLIERHTSKILEPSSTEALERAARNSVWDSRPRPKGFGPAKRAGGAKKVRAAEPESGVQVIAADADELISESSPVLVAEIPRASTRWNQANFSLETYEKFFGAKTGRQHRILLQHVEADGSLGALETRPSVEVKSRNFRFELQAASGLPYPSQGRPVGVFLRQVTGLYLYRLVLPTSPDYSAIVKLLADLWHGPAERMRRVITTAKELKKYWPTSPLWKVASMPE